MLPAGAGPALAVDLGAMDAEPGLGDAFIFDAGELDRPPRVTARVPPVYPYRARQREIEGEVRVKFLVSAEGVASRVSVVDADPPGWFEEAVLQIIPRWRFRPGVVEGRPVNAWMVTTVRFQLDG